MCTWEYLAPRVNLESTLDPSVKKPLGRPHASKVHSGFVDMQAYAKSSTLSYNLH